MEEKDQTNTHGDVKALPLTLNSVKEIVRIKKMIQIIAWW